MCSTPEPMTTSWMPEAMSAAPKFTACWAEPHWRSTVVAAASSGARSFEAAVVVTEGGLRDDDVAVLREFGKGVPVILAGPDGAVRERAST